MPPPNALPELRLHDIRLVLPAFSLWGMAALTAAGGGETLWIALVVLAGTLFALILWWCRTHPGGTLRDLAATQSTAQVLCVCLFAGLLGGAALLPHVLLVARGEVESAARHHQAQVVHGTISSRPVHFCAETQSSPRVAEHASLHRTPTLCSASRTLFTLRTAYGPATVSGRGAPWDSLVAGQHISAILRPTDAPHHHLSRGEWRGVYLRTTTPPRGLWALSRYASQQWETALTIADPWGLSPSLHALARGMSIGDTSGLPRSLAAAYRASGLTHLTAVSGANVAYLLLLAGLVVIHLSPRQKVAVFALLLAFFATLVGPEPAVLRATVSGAVTVLALWCGGRTHAFSALGAGILVLLLCAPSFAASPGFALSVIATAGLIWAARPAAVWLHTHGMPMPLAEGFAVAVTAYLATLPVGLYFFATASTLGILANLLVAPVVPIITALGLIGVGVSLLFPPAGALLAVLSVPFLRWVERCGYWFGSHRWSALALPPSLVPGRIPTLVPALLCVSLCAAIALLTATRPGRRLVVVLMVISVLSTATHAGLCYHGQARCTSNPGAVTVYHNSTGEIRVAQRPSPAAWVVLVLPSREPRLAASQLPTLDALAQRQQEPRRVLLIHPLTPIRGGFSRTGYHPRVGGAASRHLTVRERKPEAVLATTPGGTLVLQMPPGSHLTILPGGQICRPGMAR